MANDPIIQATVTHVSALISEAHELMSALKDGRLTALQAAKWDTGVSRCQEVLVQLKGGV